MDHATIQHKLDAFRDGQLSSAEVETVRTHLATCRDCRETVRRWDKIRHTFFAAQKVEPSEAFVFRVMQAMGARPSAFDWGDCLRWVVPTFALTVAALLFIFSEPMNAEEPVAVESALLRDGNSFLAEGVSSPMDFKRDWMGLEAL